MRFCCSIIAHHVRKVKQFWLSIRDFFYGFSLFVGTVSRKLVLPQCKLSLLLMCFQPWYGFCKDKSTKANLLTVLQSSTDLSDPPGKAETPEKAGQSEKMNACKKTGNFITNIFLLERVRDEVPRRSQQVSCTIELLFGNCHHVSDIALSLLR